MDLELAFQILRRCIPGRLLRRLEPYARRLYPLALRAMERVVRPLTRLPAAGGRLGPPRHVEPDPDRFAALPGVTLRETAPALSGRRETAVGPGLGTGPFSADAV